MIEAGPLILSAESAVKLGNGCDAVVNGKGDRSSDDSNIKYGADCGFWLLAFGILGGRGRVKDADCETYVAYISHSNLFACRGEPRH